MSDKATQRVAVVVPRSASHSGAVDSQLLAAVNLARGFRAEGWQVVFVTADGPCPVDLVSEASVRADRGNTMGRRRLVGRLPRWARLVLSDVRALQRRRRLRRVAVDEPLDLVVQYHHRFQDVGGRLARRAGCPVVLRVEAIEVEEQRDWGLRGPLSGRLLRTWGERRLFVAADAVATVSAPLVSSLMKLGVEEGRVRSIPNGVDATMFRPDVPPPCDELATHGLRGRFLIGWVGGFRPYHGLEQLAALLPLVERDLPGATVCLLGSGPLLHELEALRALHPTSLVLLPPVPQEQVAAWLCAFDVCLQMSRPGGGEHYSPLKVREYLACGRPVVAPASKQTPELVHEKSALLYTAGDMTSAHEAIRQLHASSERGRALGVAGRAIILRNGTWGAVARRLEELAEAVR